MTADVLRTIEDNMEDFSKGQKRIAAFVLAHYEEAAYMTAAKIAAVADVSESTVVRFAMQLGYEGYPEFTEDLAELVKSRLTPLQRIDVARQRIGSDRILEKVITMDADCVKKTVSGLSKTEFQRAVDKIVGAGSIYVVGVRSAAHLAGFLAGYLQLSCKNVRLLNGISESEIYEQMLRIGPEDVVIGISFPRYSKRTVTAMRFAHERGASTIAITDSERSPLARYADCKLFAKCEIISYVDSLVAPLSVIDALLVAVGMRKDEELRSALVQLENIWDVNDEYNSEPDDE